MGINAIIGQSGGPTSVINASLAGVFSACRAHGVPTVYGMRFGVQGLLQDKLVNLTDALSAPGALDLLRHTPASYLGSCRFKLPPVGEGEESGPLPHLFPLVHLKLLPRCFNIQYARSSRFSI